MREPEHGTLLAALRGSPFFENLDEETLLLIRATAKRVLQPRGTVVFHEGEACRGLYIVEAGAVKLYKESHDAKEHVLHVATPGDCIGEAALFLGVGYPASAAAVQDSTLILLRKDEFLTVLKNNPDICIRVMAAMAQWAHRLVSSIESLTLKDASARFADYLLSKLPPNAVDGVNVSLGIPKQVLASHLGMTGETLSRLLARCEVDGLIAVHGRKVTVYDVKGLGNLSRHGL